MQLVSLSLFLPLSFVLYLSLAAAVWKEPTHGRSWMAALFQKFTMKTSVCLLLLAAFLCGVVQSEEKAAEEVQVEVLVSVTDVLQCHSNTQHSNNSYNTLIKYAQQC